jgi:hypothetical protein
VSFFHRLLANVVEISWPTIAKTAAVALALLGLTVVAFSPGAGGEVALTALQGVLAVALMSPWIVTMLGASWSAPSSFATRDRAEVIARHRIGVRVATPVLSFVLVLPVLATAALTFADGLDVLEGLSLMSFGVFLTLILAAALQFSLGALKHDSDLIAIDIADLAPAYRANVNAVLVDRGLDLRLPVVWFALAPTIAGIVAAVVGWNRP